VLVLTDKEREHGHAASQHILFTLTAPNRRSVLDVDRERVVIQTADGAVTDEAIEHLRALFGTPEAPGSGSAASALQALEPGDTVRASCGAL
jgi:hypothetical protein